MSRFDITTVGHFSIDRIKLPDRNQTKLTLGGPPTYVSLTAKKLGADVSVVSRVGTDFPGRFRRLLERRGVDLSGLKEDKGALTTSYLLDYKSSGERRLFLGNKAPSIGAEDVPDVLDSQAVHVAPIANEVSREALRKVKASGCVVSMDPQGFVRRFGENGEVSLGRFENAEVLRGVDVLKASRDEAKAVTGQETLVEMAKSLCREGAETAIITGGAESTLLCFGGKMSYIPPAKPRAIVDTTGAGDVFIGAFLTMLVRGEEPLWCACVGSAAASFVVEKRGPSGFGSLKQVQARAMEVYEKASSIP